MTRIALVRHGETIWNAEHRYTGSSDIALTPRGEVQALALADWAVTAGLSALYTSPLARARQTAQPTADRLQIPAIVDPRLRELDFGLGEGLTSKQQAERFPAQRIAFEQDPAANFLPEGEDPRAAIVRARASLDEIAAASPGQRVLVVAHNTLIRLVLCDLLGIDPARYRQLFPKLGNVALTELQMAPDTQPALLHFNVSLSASLQGNIDAH